MTQYKTVVVPTSYDATNISYTVAAEAITMAISEQAKDGWELSLAQEMESGKSKGLFANLFGSKIVKKNTLLVFKKEDEKPQPQAAKEFDYDKFEEIVSKGVDYDKFAGIFKKVVEETEITLSKKSFAGLKLTLPTPALPMNGGDQQAALPLNVNLTNDAGDNAAKDKNAKEASAEDNNLVIAKFLYEYFSENAGKGIGFSEIKKACEGKLPEGAKEEDIITVLNAFVEHKKVKFEKELYTF